MEGSWKWESGRPDLPVAASSLHSRVLPLRGLVQMT